MTMQHHKLDSLYIKINYNTHDIFNRENLVSCDLINNHVFEVTFLVCFIRTYMILPFGSVVQGWFEKFLESPLNVSASTTRFPRNDHTSFVSEHVVRQCFCCWTVVVMTLCCCFCVLICENGKKTEF